MPVIRGRWRTMRARGIRSVLPIGIAALAQCTRPPSTDADRAVSAWMMCQECMDREMDIVVALGATVVAPLRENLLHGPPPDQMNQLRRSLNMPVIGSSESAIGDTTVRLLEIDNVVASYRIRSAMALGAIGGDAARAALCAANAASFRHLQVRITIDSALAKGGTCR